MSVCQETHAGSVIIFNVVHLYVLPSCTAAVLFSSQFLIFCCLSALTTEVFVFPARDANSKIDREI